MCLRVKIWEKIQYSNQNLSQTRRSPNSRLRNIKEHIGKRATLTIGWPSALLQIGQLRVEFGGLILNWIWSLLKVSNHQYVTVKIDTWKSIQGLKAEIFFMKTSIYLGLFQTNWIKYRKPLCVNTMRVFFLLNTLFNTFIFFN